MPSPSPGHGAILNRVDVISARDAWAAGSSGLGMFILHWNGAAWRRISIPVPADGGMLIGVFAASGRNAWAVGCTKTFGSFNARPLVLHWNGTAWN